MDKKNKSIPIENLLVILVIVIGMIYYAITSIVSRFTKDSSNASNTTVTSTKRNDTTTYGSTINLNGVYAATSPEAYKVMNDFVLASEGNQEQLLSGFNTMLMNGVAVYLGEGTKAEIAGVTFSTGTCILVKTGPYTGRKFWVMKFMLE